MRTTVSAVQKILGNNWQRRQDVSPYIETATVKVDQLVDAAAAAELSVIPVATLELIERWLSAYYYTIMDPLYLEKRTERAHGKYPERSYMDVAVQLDPTGLLKGLLCNDVVQIEWLGKPPSEQLPYWQRD